MDTAEIRRRGEKARTYLPDSGTRDDIVGFARTLKELDEFLASNNGKAALKAPDGSERFIPTEIFEILEHVANTLASGKGVTVAPYGMQLTTQEAADYLGISRPTLVKLLDEHVIPHEKRGRHRRVTLKDLVEYQERFRVERREALRDMARSGQVANAAAPPLPYLERLGDTK